MSKFGGCPACEEMNGERKKMIANVTKPIIRIIKDDELWNLMPMDSLLNSAKNNRLPDWNDFFIRFARNQYIMYEMIHEREGIRKLYEACYRDNLHSIWANQELYRKGNSDTEFYGILEKNMRPVYDSARRQGYDVWEKRLAV